MNSEIQFTGPVLHQRFDALIEGLLGLLDVAYAMGRANPHVEELFVDGQGGSLVVSDEVVGSDEFAGLIDESVDCIEQFRDEMQNVPARSNECRSTAREREYAFRIADLERSLARAESRIFSLANECVNLRQRLLTELRWHPLSHSITLAWARQDTVPFVISTNGFSV